jgi:uncharacterized protein involved in type VI secretion and phage assembly
MSNDVISQFFNFQKKSLTSILETILNDLQKEYFLNTSYFFQKPSIFSNYSKSSFLLQYG